MSQLRNPHEPAHALLAFVADVELELDVLRKQIQFTQQTITDTINEIRRLCTTSASVDGEPSVLAQIDDLASDLQKVLVDLHAAHQHSEAVDSVTVIELQPFVEQLFRWQQRLLNSPYTALRLEFAEDRIAWFPARLRHILENLISNAIRYRDNGKGETRLTLSERTVGETYEFRLTDNGRGIAGPNNDSLASSQLSSPARSAGLSVGLSVVRVLVEQTGGHLETYSDRDQGTSIVLVLPRYELNDFLSS